MNGQCQWGSWIKKQQQLCILISKRGWNFNCSSTVSVQFVRRGQNRRDCLLWMIPTLAWPTFGDMGDHLYWGTRIFYRNDFSYKNDPVCIYTWRVICLTEAHVQGSSSGATEAVGEADFCQNSGCEGCANSAGGAVLTAPACSKWGDFSREASECAACAVDSAEITPFHLLYPTVPSKHWLRVSKGFEHRIKRLSVLFSSTAKGCSLCWTRADWCQYRKLTGFASKCRREVLCQQC